MHRFDALSVRAHALTEEHDPRSGIDQPVDVQRLLAWFYGTPPPPAERDAANR